MTNSDARWTVRRLAAAGSVLVVGAALLAGCTHEQRQVVPGGEGTSGVGSQAPTAGAAIVGGPLTAKDLPGWSDAVLPDGDVASLVSVCDGDLGVAPLQRGARARAVTTPLGLQVVTKVATYDDGDLGAAMSQVDSVLSSCSVWSEGEDLTTVTPLRSVGGGRTTGVLLVRQGEQSASQDVTAYIIAATANGTVEVRVRVHLQGQELSSSLTDFTSQVLSAAQRKALGSPVGVVRSPELVDLDAPGGAPGGQATSASTTGSGEESSSSGGTQGGGGEVSGEGGIAPQEGAGPGQDVYGPLDGS